MSPRSSPSSTLNGTGSSVKVSAHEGARHRELDAVGRKLDGLIDAIARGIRSTSLQQKLDELEARKAGELSSEPCKLSLALVLSCTPGWPTFIARGLRACRQLLMDLTARPPSKPCGRSSSASCSTLRPTASVASRLSYSARSQQWLPWVRTTRTTTAAGVPGVMNPFDSSIKVVAGARNHLDLLLVG